MTWLVTGKQYIPVEIGEAFGGGYFAGYISHTADGSPTHALIVAPRETGATGAGYTLTTNYQWKTADTSTPGSFSLFDGAANTIDMVTAGIANHPAAQFCVGLSIGGFTDWYLPSRLELDIAYFNLKPGTAANATTTGINVYAVPARASNYATSDPAQTAIVAFNTSVEAFLTTGNHWASTQQSAALTNVFSFNSGINANAGKTSSLLLTRAFRRIAL